MPVTSYISVGGRIISEVTDGVILDYVPDALGSIHSVIDQDANVVKTMRYKPYGEVLSRSGTVADRHYQWVGTYGYRATFAPSSSHYVRARHYSATAGSWTTVDPLWPDENAYGYVGGRSALWTDSRGSDPYSDCIAKAQNHLMTIREACEYCQQKKTPPKSKAQAQRICAHLPNTRPGPKPPGTVPNPNGGHYNDPPNEIGWVIGVCGSFMPLGSDVMANLPGAGKDVLCIKALKDLDKDWNRYCALDESSPGRVNFPGASQEYWDNYCSALAWAINEWKKFCAPK